MKSSTTSNLPPLMIDTWGWLALESAAEARHREVLEIRRRYSSQGGVWITTGFILDETITRLFSRRPFDEASRFMSGIEKAREMGLVQLERISDVRFEAAHALRLQYRDKPRISFTDLTTFAVMGDLAVERVLTGDAHFRQSGLGFVALP